MQKVARKKGAEKKGKKRKIETREPKKSKFWLMRMRQLKILYICVLNLQENVFFLIGKRLFSKIEAHLATWQPKNGLNGKKTDFL